ncbi:MAG: tail protein X [Planctomycetia bacterium]|nr:tail protein X [Planctomycetia bacterium]
MQRESNVNAGTKLLTAGVVMTLGVGGALLFRQAPVEPARAESVADDLLVRRSNLPQAATGFVGQAPEAGIPSGSGGAAQFTGTIDPFRNRGTPAGSERRVASEYVRAEADRPVAAVAAVPGISSYGSPPPQLGSPYFVGDPLNEAERTPMHNITSNPQLPAEYPAPTATDVTSAAAPATQPLSTTTSSTTSPFGPPLAISSPLGADKARSQFTGVGVNSVGNADGGSRVVMPTLRAGSGADARSQPLPAASQAHAGQVTPPPEQSRVKASKPKRHRVRDGETLASLAERYYGNAERYIAIYDANRGVLSNPDLLPIGVELAIPPADQAAASAAAADVATPPTARLLPRVQIRPLGE